MGGVANLSALSVLTANLGDVIQPRVISATPSSPTVVRVAFDDEMANNSQLVSKANYQFQPTGGGAVVDVLAVIPEATTYPTYVDVTTTEHTDNEGYTVIVSNVTDRYLNAIDPAHDDASYTGQGTLPQLSSAEVRTSTKLRVHFSEEMMLNSALTTPGNYSLTPITPGAAPLFISDIETPAGDNYPDYVDLIISEMTDGATYELVVSNAGPTDRALNTVDPAADTDQFVGVGVPPSVLQVIAVGPNRVDVVFNEPMADNADIRDPAKYQWDNGLSTVQVLDFDQETVQLVTGDQTEGLLYTLTITN